LDKIKLIKNDWFGLALVISIAAAYLLPYVFGNNIPGDEHDSRITIFVLENAYQSVVNGTQNILNGAFGPWPYSILLSEPLWGSAPVYLFFSRICR